MSDANRDWIVIAVAGFLALLGTIASHVASSGAALGAIIGGISFATLITPPLALAVSRPRARVFISASITFGVGIAWLAATRDVRAFVVLLSYVASLAGLANGFSRARVNASIASTVLTLGALAWLAWPVWLAPQVANERTIARMVNVHPVFALNSLSKTQAVWTQLPVMYHLTPLGQDVSYRLPSSVWPCVILHAVIAMLLLISPRAQKPARLDAALPDR